MTDSLPTMLAPDAVQRAVDDALARLREDVPAADIGGARLRFTQAGATVHVYTRFRLRHADGSLGGAMDRTWTGDITAEGYVALRW